MKCCLFEKSEGEVSGSGGFGFNLELPLFAPTQDAIISSPPWIMNKHMFRIGNPYPKPSFCDWNPGWGVFHRSFLKYLWHFHPMGAKDSTFEMFPVLGMGNQPATSLRFVSHGVFIVSPSKD